MHSSGIESLPVGVGFVGVATGGVATGGVGVGGVGVGSEGEDCGARVVVPSTTQSDGIWRLSEFVTIVFSKVPE